MDNDTTPIEALQDCSAELDTTRLALVLLLEKFVEVAGEEAR